MAGRTRAESPLFVLVALALIVCPPALAQSTTAGIRGTVSDDTGVLPGVTIVAQEQASGFRYEAVTEGDGTFTLAGLRPGTYDITVTMDRYKPAARTVQVLLGQTPTVDFRITPDLIYTEEVNVVGTARLTETRTSQVATNVTQDQISFLPQNTRNFLNFAALAPGLRVTEGDTSKQVQAAGQPANQLNVFIDGVSYKNDVIQGGIVGQDSSRGNPFPQNAVQEFQVLTQNFKAEYEKASTAIITAITKSGSNRWSGELFNFYQDKDLVEKEHFARLANLPKPSYERWQWGGSAGGPLVRDRMQVFGTFEENRQDRDALVSIGTVTNVPASLVQSLSARQGIFPSPFRSRLFFGKLSAQPRQGQNLEVTYNLRDEFEIRGFGSLSSYEAAEDFNNRVDNVLAKYQLAGSTWLNELYGSYQYYLWNPVPLNPDVVGIDYQGVMRVGGRDTLQDITQKRLALRNDHSRFANWRGDHAFKLGGVVNYSDYVETKFFTYNPVYTFRGDISWDFPATARYGGGDPTHGVKNWQVGLFAQDDWRVGSRLTLNLGLRWDYESNMLNNEYVTPDNVRTATAPFVDDERYFTDGDDRPPFYGAVQPRLGFSYDVTGNGNTIAFGGYGRYYDRVIFNAVYDENFRLQYAVRTFQFSTSGGIRDGQQTIPWNPSYLTRQGLDTLIQLGVAPNPEVFLIANDTEPPVSDQFSLGVRQRLWNLNLSASYSGLRSDNGFTFLFGNRRADGACCQPIPGFSNILISSDARKAWYDALFLQTEKPYGIGGNWGFSLTYTLSAADQIGGDLFSLDFPTVEDYPRHPSPTDERHRLVMSAIVGLPLDFLASTFITLGSGLPFTITDQSRGSGVNQRRVLRNEGRPEQFDFIIPDAWAYRSVDVRLEKAFRLVNTHRISALVEAFNVFSFENFTNFDGLIPTLPATNPNFGKPRNTLDPGRRVQFGIRYMF